MFPLLMHSTEAGPDSYRRTGQSANVANEAHLTCFEHHSNCVVANCPYFRGTVPLFLRGCPSKDSKISIVVPPTNIGYNDHIWKCIDFIWKCPYFLPTNPTFFTDVSLLLVLGGWQLCNWPGRTLISILHNMYFLDYYKLKLQPLQLNAYCMTFDPVSSHGTCRGSDQETM